MDYYIDTESTIEKSVKIFHRARIEKSALLIM